MFLIYIAIAILRRDHNLGLLVGHNKEYDVQFDKSCHTVTIVASIVPKYFSHQSRTMSIRGKGLNVVLTPVALGRLYYSRYYTHTIKLGNYPK